VNGVARSIKLNPTDTRDVRQRISDNYSNLGSNFSDRADEANRKMFEHNAKLDRWGNSMEFINGVAAGALNPFISAGEALGIGDILYGTRYAIDKAAMRNIAPLPAEGKFAAIGGLGSVAGFEKNTREAVDRWIQENPNAAETVEAVFNVAAAAKVAKLAKAAKPGKAAVSGDFSISYKNFSTVKPKVIAKGTINGKTFRDVNQSAKIGSPDSPTLIAQRVNAKIQADGKPRPNATVANSHAEIGVIQQAYNAGETKGASMTMTVSGKDVCGYCKGDIAAAAQASGLKSLTVNATDNVTGKNKTYYWTPGMKSIKERK
ncbi:TPA: MafB family polymorphic toxin, partial [Neisseria gonorrhoeae]